MKTYSYMATNSITINFRVMMPPIWLAVHFEFLRWFIIFSWVGNRKLKTFTFNFKKYIL